MRLHVYISRSRRQEDDIIHAYKTLTQTDRIETSKSFSQASLWINPYRKQFNPVLIQNLENMHFAKNIGTLTTFYYLIR